MKLGFATCVKLGLTCMKSIYKEGEKLDFVITLPDDKAKKKSGRVYVDDFCKQHNVPLIKSSHINNSDVIEAIHHNNIDWLFIIGWSQIASKNILKAPKKGVIGIHPTLLPDGRGRASIPWAILKDLKKTGVTMFKMDEGIDTGPIIAQIEVPMTRGITATKLYSLIEEAHYNLIKKMIKPILDEKIKLIDQDETKAKIWPGRSPEDGEINLKGSVYDAEKLVRAVTHPFPGAFYYHNKIKQIVWSAKVLKFFDKKLDLKKDRYLEFKDGILLIES